nr:hypothetical protein GCM10020092_072270 [Actinoplanes digitatis]
MAESTLRRAPLSRERVLHAAVALADVIGIEALSMRKLAQDLGVVPMALYKHVANRDELVDGMVDTVVAEIDAPEHGTAWQPAVRRRVLSARRTMLRHPWVSRAIETRQAPTPAVLAYLDSVIGMFRVGGFSADLTHHVMHAMGSRVLGFTQELFTQPELSRPRRSRGAGRRRPRAGGGLPVRRGDGPRGRARGRVDRRLRL